MVTLDKDSAFLRYKTPAVFIRKYMSKDLVNLYEFLIEDKAPEDIIYNKYLKEIPELSLNPKPSLEDIITYGIYIALSAEPLDQAIYTYAEKKRNYKKNWYKPISEELSGKISPNNPEYLRHYAEGVQIAKRYEKKNIDLQQCINETGMGFMNAMKFHKAMKNVGPIRKEIGIRTIFNMLGPLSNPSNASRQVIGVFSPEKVSVFAKVMSEMGVKRAMIVCGSDGMDEITVTGKTLVNEIIDGKIVVYEIDPHDYGIEYAAASDITGGDGKENAEIAKSIFNGEKSARRDIIVLNSAAGIYIGGKADSYKEAVEIAKQTIDSGKVMDKVNEFVAETKKFN